MWAHRTLIVERKNILAREGRGRFCFEYTRLWRACAWPARQLVSRAPCLCKYAAHILKVIYRGFFDPKKNNNNIPEYSRMCSSGYPCYYAACQCFINILVQLRAHSESGWIDAVRVCSLMSPVVILLAVQLQVLSPGQSVSIALLQARSLHRWFHTQRFSVQDCSVSSGHRLQVPTNANPPFHLNARLNRGINYAVSSLRYVWVNVCQTTSLCLAGEALNFSS